jgi:hypothetical protein
MSSSAADATYLPTNLMVIFNASPISFCPYLAIRNQVGKSATDILLRIIRIAGGQTHGPEAPGVGLLLTGARSNRLAVIVTISTGIAKSPDWPLGFKQNTKPSRTRRDGSEAGQSDGTLKRLRARNLRLGASKMGSSAQMIDALVACPAGVTLKATRTLPSSPARRAWIGYQSMFSSLDSRGNKCGVLSLADSSPRLTLSTQHASTAIPQPQSKRPALRILSLAITSPGKSAPPCPCSGPFAIGRGGAPPGTSPRLSFRASGGRPLILIE